MKKLYYVFMLFGFGVMALNSNAQTDSVAAKKSYLKFGISFLSNDVYVGRTDTVTTPSFAPRISYNFRSGVYFAGELDYYTNRKNNKLDGGSLEAGYNFDLSDDLGGGISFSKQFYNSNSTQVQSTISSDFSAFLDYNLANIITPAMGFDYSFSKNGYKDDYLFTPALSHDFEAFKLFDESDKLLISPEFDVNFGTQNFYAGYLERLVVKQQKRSKFANQELAAYNQNLTDDENYLNQAKLLDYELTLPLSYENGAFIFTMKPVFAFPQNGLPPANNTYQKAIQSGLAPLNNRFFITLGVSLKF